MYSRASKQSGGGRVRIPGNYSGNMFGYQKNGEETAAESTLSEDGDMKRHSSGIPGVDIRGGIFPSQIKVTDNIGSVEVYPIKEEETVEEDAFEPEQSETICPECGECHEYRTGICPGKTEDGKDSEEEKPDKGINPSDETHEKCDDDKKAEKKPSKDGAGLLGSLFSADGGLGRDELLLLGIILLLAGEGNGADVLPVLLLLLFL